VVRFLVVGLVLSLLEGTHAFVVQRIRESSPSVVPALGLTGPGYYFFGLFWFHPTYRQLLTSGKLKAMLAHNPSVARLASYEVLLWYSLWLVTALAVLL
jgi:hypothetical protein